jgi:hypothetical protein
MTSCHMSKQRVTQKNIWCRLREAHLGSLLTTQESALSDLLRITSILVLFTSPVPHTRDQTPEDNGLGKCTFSSYRQEHSSTENFAVYQTHCPFYQKKGGLLSLARDCRCSSVFALWRLQPVCLSCAPIHSL